MSVLNAEESLRSLFPVILSLGEAVIFGDCSEFAIVLEMMTDSSCALV